MQNKIRLLQVIPNLNYGGAETGCIDIANFISKNNFFSAISCANGKQLSNINRDLIKIIKLPVHSKNPIIIILNIFLLFFVSLIYKINIIHVRSRAPAWSCYFVARLTKISLVSTFHGTYNFNNFFKKFYNSIMLKGNCIIAGSKFISGHIQKNYKVNKPIFVIPRGIDTSYFDPKNRGIEETDLVRNKWKVDKNKYLILLPGRLTLWKGQMLFLKTLSHLKKESLLNNFTAVILGSEQGRSQYKNSLIHYCKNNNIESDVRFIEHEGFMPSAYNASDLIISASIEPEAFGRVAVEAQAMQRPILVSNIGGSLETVIDKKTGWHFESGDQSSLAKKIVEISKIEKKELELIGVNARAHVVNNYTIEQMCSKTLEIYKALV